MSYIFVISALASCWISLIFLGVVIWNRRLDIKKIKLFDLFSIKFNKN